MVLPINGSTHLIPTYYSIYRPRKDERLSWPSWLIYSGWLTHISGHPSAASRAQDRESSPARNRRSTTVPRHQPIRNNHTRQSEVECRLAFRNNLHIASVKQFRLLVTSVTPAETAEPIEMPSGTWTHAGPKEPRFTRGLGSPTAMGESYSDPLLQGALLGSHTWACPRSIFSTLFASGHQRCELWLSVP